MPLQIPDQSIANSMPEPPTMMQSLSDIMALKKARLDYQIKDTANNRLNTLRSIAADPSLTNPDGSFNNEAAANRYAALGPDGQTAQTSALASQGTGITNSTNQLNLNQGHQNIVMRYLGALSSDPDIVAAARPDFNSLPPAQQAQIRMGIREKIYNAGNAMVSGGLPADEVEKKLEPTIQAANANPGVFRQNLLNMQMQGMAPTSQVDAQTPSGINVGNGQITYTSNTKPTAGPIGSAIPGTIQKQQITPAEMQTVTKDSNGNFVTVNKDASGQVTNVGGAPVQGVGVTPPAIIPQGETPDSRNALMNLRAATNSAAAKVGDLHTYNQNVIRIASDPAMINPNTWAGSGAKAAARLGIPEGTDYKTALDMISHNLAMATQANEKAMGVNTDAGRHTADLAMGSTAMTPQALASAAKMNDATTTAIDFFNKGQEKAIGKNGDNNVYAIRKFQNDWASAYTPVVMQLYNAKKSGDTNEIQNIIRGTGYQGPIAQFKDTPQGKEIARRTSIIANLANTGSAK
ncbi:MAG: hypothetical protein NVS3B3_16010 [Aquirhabdus sp.]